MGKKKRISFRGDFFRDFGRKVSRWLSLEGKRDLDPISKESEGGN